jgi:hypothetical protein
LFLIDVFETTKGILMIRVSFFDFPRPQNCRRFNQAFLACCVLLPLGFENVQAAEDISTPPAEYTIQEDPAGPIILRDGETMAQLLAESGAKPVIYPLIGPGGLEMTRHYPIAESLPTEKEDHIHHRSFWFTHGDVNGVDFWAEGEGHGRIKQTQLTATETNGSVKIQTENDWLDAAGDRVLSDSREIVFRDVGGMRAVDFTVQLKATDGPVVFGDTKEGTFGIRVAGTMKVDAGQGGTVVSSDGLQNSDAWGKPAAWVDYYGPVRDKTVGIAILNHPSSFGFPTRWHVRTYGLFAANPFGVHHFTGGEPTDGVRLEKGETLTLKYRVLLHQGTTAQAEIAKAFASYANGG